MGEKSTGERTSIYDTDIVRWLYANKERLRPGDYLPALILDPIVPPSSGSMDETLLARNRLAAGIYCDAPVVAVVAAGLVATGSADRLQEQWIRGLNAGRPLLGIVGEMQQYADSRSPIALFAPSTTFGLGPVTG